MPFILLHISGRAMGSGGHLKQRTGVQFQANPCGICVGQNGSGTGFSPITSNYPVCINPSVLHIHSVIYYESYIILGIDTYRNFHTRNIANRQTFKEDLFHFWK